MQIVKITLADNGVIKTVVDDNINAGGESYESTVVYDFSDQISKMLESMEKESNDIRQEALKMAWYMLGGLTYEQAMTLGVSERKLINVIIKENLETTKKSGLPFF